MVKPGFDGHPGNAGLICLMQPVAVVVAEHFDSGLSLRREPVPRDAPAAIDRIGPKTEGQGHSEGQIAMIIDRPLAAQRKPRELPHVAN